MVMTPTSQVLEPPTIPERFIMAAGKKAGLIDIKVCAVDDTWSGLKFVIPVGDRG